MVQEDTAGQSLSQPKKEIIKREILPQLFSPVHNVSAGAPPTIIFHGTSDTSVPFRQAVNFCEIMTKYGNHCEVVPFEGREHGFFNYGKGDNPDFLATMEHTVKFLTSIGYLKGEPGLK